MWRFCQKMELEGAEGEEDEAGEDAGHAEQFRNEITFLEDYQSIRETYHRTTPAHRAHYRYQRVRVTQR